MSSDLFISSHGSNFTELPNSMDKHALVSKFIGFTPPDVKEESTTIFCSQHSTQKCIFTEPPSEEVLSDNALLFDNEKKLQDQS